MTRTTEDEHDVLTIVSMLRNGASPTLTAREMVDILGLVATTPSLYSPFRRMLSISERAAERAVPGFDVEGYDPDTATEAEHEAFDAYGKAKDDALEALIGELETLTEAN